MDLFSFTTIIIILFVIIGAYILLTSQIEGRARVVLILSVTIAFFVILFNLPIFKFPLKEISFKHTRFPSIFKSCFPYMLPFILISFPINALPLKNTF